MDPIYTLGLYKEGDTCKAALLFKENGKIKIETLHSFSESDPSSSVKPFDILSPFLSKKKIKTVSGLEAWEMLIRELSFNLKNKSAVLKVLPFQLSSLIPYPVEQLILLPFLSQKGKNTTDVQLFATTKPSLTSHLEQYKALGVDPDQVSCTPMALLRFTNWAFKEESSIVAFYLGEFKSSYIWIEDAKIKLSQTLSIGRQDFVAALKKDLPEYSEEMSLHSYDLWDETKFPHLFHCKKQFQRDFERASAFLKSKNGDTPIERLFFCGNLLPKQELSAFLENAASTSFTCLKLPEHTPDISSYAIAMGLALDGLLDDERTVEYRVSSFVSVKKAKKRKQAILSYFAACLLLSIITLSSTYFLKEQREEMLIKKLQSYVPQEIRQEESSHMSLEDLLTLYEKKLGKQKRAFAYHPTVATVSDLLAWLSSSSPFNQSPSSPAEKEEGLEIKKVRYHITKYPKIGSKAETWGAQVEIEFVTTSARLAREVRDLLMAGGDPFIDASAEISWSAQDNTYRTSFFLSSKNKGTKK